ncbi:MAG: hypothetical protein ACM362_05075 [Candidatus Methylomirabilota bacterium]
MRDCGRVGRRARWPCRSRPSRPISPGWRTCGNGRPTSRRAPWSATRPSAGPSSSARTGSCMRRRSTPTWRNASRPCATGWRWSGGGGAAKGAHVKLGSGGIADIEFLVQYLQLRHGRTHPSLRMPSTLEALRSLVAERLLPPGEAVTLEESYRFLRRVENRLRIVADLSVNTLPAAPAKLEKLAKRLGYQPQANGTARDRFLEDFAAHTSRVRTIYQQTLGKAEAGA